MGAGNIFDETLSDIDEKMRLPYWKQAKRPVGCCIRAAAPNGETMNLTELKLALACAALLGYPASTFAQTNNEMYKRAAVAHPV